MEENQSFNYISSYQEEMSYLSRIKVQIIEDTENLLEQWISWFLDCSAFLKNHLIITLNNAQLTLRM